MSILDDNIANDGQQRPCYWITNVHRCEDSHIHTIIVIIGVVFNLLPFFYGSYIIWIRSRWHWRGMLVRVRGFLLPSPIESILVFWTLTCFIRIIYLSLLSLDVIHSRTVREVLFMFALYPYLIGVLLFLSGLVGAIPPSFTWNHSGRWRQADTRCGRLRSLLSVAHPLTGEANVYVPPPRILQALTVISLLWHPLAVMPIVTVGSYRSDYYGYSRGPWRSIGFLLLAVQTFIMFIAIIYYSNCFAAMFRGQSAPTATATVVDTMSGLADVAPEESIAGPSTAAQAAARRVRRVFIGLILSTLIACIAFGLWGLGWRYIIQHTVFSIIMNLMINSVVCPMSMLLILRMLHLTTYASLRSRALRRVSTMDQRSMPMQEAYTPTPPPPAASRHLHLLDTEESVVAAATTAAKDKLLHNPFAKEPVQHAYYQHDNSSSDSEKPHTVVTVHPLPVHVLATTRTYPSSPHNTNTSPSNSQKSTSSSRSGSGSVAARILPTANASFKSPTPSRSTTTISRNNRKSSLPHLSLAAKFCPNRSRSDDAMLPEHRPFVPPGQEHQYGPSRPQSPDPYGLKPPTTANPQLAVASSDEARSGNSSSGASSRDWWSDPPAKTSTSTEHSTDSTTTAHEPHSPRLSSISHFPGV